LPTSFTSAAIVFVAGQPVRRLERLWRWRAPQRHAFRLARGPSLSDHKPLTTVMTVMITQPHARWLGIGQRQTASGRVA